MSVPYLPKSINMVTAGLGSVALAFPGHAGTFNVWEAQRVPRLLAVDIKTAAMDARPGAPTETIVTITPKEFLAHPVSFALSHQTDAKQPPEIITVTLSEVLLA